MTDDRPIGTVAVVDTGQLSHGTIQMFHHKLQGLVQDGTVPKFEVIREDEMLKANAALAAVLASTSSSLQETLEGPPKRPKEEKPLDVQARLKIEAERKRQRRRHRRLTKGT